MNCSCKLYKGIFLIQNCYLCHKIVSAIEMSLSFLFAIKRFFYKTTTLISSLLRDSVPFWEVSAIKHARYRGSTVQVKNNEIWRYYLCWQCLAASSLFPRSQSYQSSSNLRGIWGSLHLVVYARQQNYNPNGHWRPDNSVQSIQCNLLLLVTFNPILWGLSQTKHYNIIKKIPDFE